MTVDLTGVATTLIAGVFSVLSIVIPLMINSRMKDKQAAEVIDAAVKNSLGAIQQAATSSVVSIKPQIGNVPPDLAPGVQYVLDHAGPELARYTDITPERIASKISAQIGLANIATNIATASGVAPTPAPLAAVTSTIGATP